MLWHLIHGIHLIFTVFVPIIFSSLNAANINVAYKFFYNLDFIACDKFDLKFQNAVSMREIKHFAEDCNPDACTE